MNDYDVLWDHDEPVVDFGIDVPSWIESDITAADVAAVIQGGCESGAYMPAVTYHEASCTMDVFGDAVLDFIEEATGEICYPESPTSWSGLAVHFLSLAVELWCYGIVDELAEIIEEEEE
jgi:hypothetical protein